MWHLVLPPPSPGGPPKALQIARVIAADIERGRLRPGDPLPSTRKLAQELATQRKVITAAYAELARQGWISIAAARGAQVAADVPRLPRRRRVAPVAQHAGFALPAGRDAAPAAVGRPRGTLLLLGGVPELRFVPQLQLGRAYRSVLASRDGARLLDYGDSQGDLQLREALAEMLRRTRGLTHDAGGLAVVRGGQQALYLAVRALLPSQPRVAVEALGYPMAWGAFRAAGAELVPVPVDREGLNVDALEQVLRERPVHAVHISPHHHVPTTVTMSASRRIRLLALAAARRIAILEDDHDHEFQYDGSPVLPLASSDPHGVVVYVGTLSKVLAPGLRLGYVAATSDVIGRLVAYRELVDQQGDLVLERALAGLFQDGTIERHVRRARREYRSRREALCEALARDLPDLRFTSPPGGMAVWARAPGVDTAAWAARARTHGVVFQPGARFALQGGAREHARLGFAACTPRELAEAVRRMAAARHAMGS